MKTSARNQFDGVVKEVILGAVNAEVIVGLPGGETIIASVTKDSIAALDIKEGAPVIALVKAPQVTLITDFGGYKVSARNQIGGEISAVKPGAVNTEVDINISGGHQIIATVTNDSATGLNLHVGQAVTAVFKAGSVLLGVAA